MRIGSLFSGVGGLDLAALDLFPGASMAWHCEIEPSAAKVLAHHWPDVPNLGDVTGIDWAAIEPVDVVTAGFPCQDVSLAGRRAGLHHGTRSGLWHHVVEAIGQVRPRYVLLENVRGLLSADGDEWPDSVIELDRQAARWGRVSVLIDHKIAKAEKEGRASGEWRHRKERERIRASRLRKRFLAEFRRERNRLVQRAIATVLADLAGLGLDAEWACVRASDVGACHRRERVFILAYPADAASDGRQGVDDSTGGAAARGSGLWVASGGARNA